VATTVEMGETAIAGLPLRSALAKARWRILPLLSICYLVAYMDRANISFAAKSMNRDLHFTATTYGLGAGLFFLAYALCEVPSNWLMLRVGARRWLARIMLTWGLLAAAMVLVRSTRSFYGARMLLGCAEAGYFPGALYFLSQWFPRATRARAISWFYVSLPLSSLVMGGLAGVLLGLDGKLGLKGWQWMFLVEAAPAVVLAFGLWFALPDDVASAPWLSREERTALAGELAADEAAATDGVEAVDVWGVLRTGRVWVLGLVYFFELGVSYALVFSLPLVLGQLTGWDTARVGYLVAGSGVAGGALMVGVAWLSDRSGKPRQYVVGGFLLMAVGALAAGLNLQGWSGAAALLLVPLSYYAMQGPMLGVLTTMLPGKASALAIATANMCGIVGGFVGPYWMGWMRDRTGGYAVGIGSLCVPCALSAVLMMRLLRERQEIEIDQPGSSTKEEEAFG
jgi:MFS transporter, ACS family, tartrate transporter